MSLHYLELRGSHYEIGQQLGRFGAEAVHQHLLKSAAWEHLCTWRHSDALGTMQQLVQTHFPTIWQEIEGLAHGLELSVADTFLWNSRGDLWAMAPDSCSSVLQLDPLPRISHNEDGDPGFYGHCAVASIAPTHSTAFNSFVYPGSIAGHTFAINQHQLVMTVNNIRALHVLPGVPRMVLCRAILDCTQVSEAIQLLRAYPRAGAFNLNLGDQQAALHSVEFGYYGVSAVAINQPYFHANHAIHPSLRDYPQIITGSSGHRQVQGQQLLGQHTGAVDALAVLGDDAHARFPIYRRQADDTDNENTIATADFVYTDQGVEWAVYDNPLKAPLFQFINLHKQ